MFRFFDKKEKWKGYPLDKGELGVYNPFDKLNSLIKSG